MKAYPTIIILFFLSLNWGYAQTHVRIKVPIVKENAEIDGLVKLILDPKTPAQFTSAHSDIKVDCIAIRLEKSKDSKQYDFLISMEPHLGVNYIMNAVVKDIKNDFGCFKYKNYNVFIWSSTSINNFVHKTSGVNTFKFIYKMNNQLDPSINTNETKLWMYIYENGHFSKEVIPVVR